MKNIEKEKKLKKKKKFKENLLQKIFLINF